MQFLGNKQHQKDSNSNGLNANQGARQTNGVTATTATSTTQNAGSAPRLFAQPSGAAVASANSIATSSSSSSSTNSSQFSNDRTELLNDAEPQENFDHDTAEPITIPHNPTGPDYIKVFRDIQDEAVYCLQEFTDWNRHKTGPRGAAAFLKMLQVRFPAVGTQCPDGDVNKLTFTLFNRAMIAFAEDNNVDSLRWCIELGADPGFINDEGYNVLTAAASCGSNKVIEYLLDELGLNVSKYSRNKTALLDAALGGHESTIHLLVEKGAWLSEVNPRGSNVLHYLLHKKGHVAIAKSILLKYTVKYNQLGNRAFDFHQINSSNENILGAAFKYLILQQSDNITKETPVVQIQNIVTPGVEICRLIKNITGLPYAAETQYEGRKSYTPIKPYVNDDDTCCAAYIGDLFKCAHDFLKEIENDPKNDMQHEDLIKFKRIHAELERRAVTQSMFKK